MMQADETNFEMTLLGAGWATKGDHGSAPDRYQKGMATKGGHVPLTPRVPLTDRKGYQSWPGDQGRARMCPRQMGRGTGGGWETKVEQGSAPDR